MRNLMKFKAKESEAEAPDGVSKAKKKEPVSVAHRILTVIGIILCVILIPLLISNIVLIIQSYTNKDKVPSVFTISPMIVMTDSMKPAINSGDLIFVKRVDAEAVAVDDVIAFFDPASKRKSVVTHRVVEVVTGEDGALSFRTRGDANDLDDRLAVPAENLIGRYSFRLRGVGSVAMFMQTTAGLIVCVVVPLFLLIGYDIVRRRLYEKKHKVDTDALMAELEALKAEKALAEKGTADAESAPQNDAPQDGENP